MQNLIIIFDIGFIILYKKNPGRKKVNEHLFVIHFLALL